MIQKRSIKAIAKRAIREDKRVRDKMNKTEGSAVLDSFVNFSQMLGIGADNPLSGASYGFNPITRIRTLLEWIHRGSWLGGVAIDLVADDMTRAGVELVGELKPEQMEAIEETAVATGVWNSINEAIKWGRLYGGSLAVIMIDGQSLATPLRLETVGKKAFKGLLVLDRWMVESSMQDLVTDFGPDLGLPKYYSIVADAPALPNMKIHHSRCLRLQGIQLPYWQRMMENMWGISEIERIYDRMVAFDSATTGAAQLVYKAYIRTYKIKGLRALISAGGVPLAGLVKFVEMMRRFQGIEGMTLLDAEDDFIPHSQSAFSGLSDALMQFGQQLSGALQIPLVRLFGQSPAGLNASGESDLKTYYDGILQKQEKLRVPVTNIYRAIAASESIKLPEGFKIKFRPLWQLTDEQKANIALTVTQAVTQAEEAGLITQKGGMTELQQSSEVTGIYSNITDADIAAAEESLPPAGEEAMRMEQEHAETLAKTKGGAPGGKAGDTIATVVAMKKLHDLDIVIENPKGSIRTGKDWEVAMPADYGYLRRTNGADGQQVDCYVGPDHDSGDVWVVDQIVPESRQFDEHKVLLGYSNLHEAMADYLNGYTDGSGWSRIGAVRRFGMEDFKSWLGRE